MPSAGTIRNILLLFIVILLSIIGVLLSQHQTTDTIQFSSSSYPQQKEYKFELKIEEYDSKYIVS